MQAKLSQAECLLLYKINWSTEGTEGLVEKKTAVFSKQRFISK